MAISREKIFEEVKEVLVDALGLDEDEVQPKSTLMGDLGAESIDFLDIVFRLEKSFSVKIPREELFPTEGLMNNPEYVKDGKMTQKGLEAMAKSMPHTDFSSFAANPDVNKIQDLFTVDSIVNFLEAKLAA
jgi:acyl carrier protein